MVLKTIIPNAARTLTGLANQGYIPQTAIADLVDNSISANASKIEIRFTEEFGGNYVVSIGDNGEGMDESTLEAAMQIGSSSTLARSSLSVYGMGMKAASMSFSRRFTVVSRTSTSGASQATWDIDSQIDNPWTIDIGEASLMNKKLLDQATDGGPGTIVIWEKANFSEAALDNRKIKGRSKGIGNIESAIKQYLGMAFQRFIDGKVKGYPPLLLLLNNEIIQSWNPVDESFLSEDWIPRTDELEVEVLIDDQNENVPYTMTTYRVLGKDEERNKGNLSRNGMKTQGIHVYREDRLLQLPDWLGTLVFHPDLNSMRVVLELDPKLDALTRTDMKKSGLALPPVMRDDIYERLDFYSRGIKELNQKKKNLRKSKRDMNKLHQKSNETINNAIPDIEQARGEKLPDGTTKLETIFGENITQLTHLDVSFATNGGRIQPVDDIVGGVLFEPVFQGAELVVLINKSHPFYQKIYMGLLDEPLATQGFDFLLFSLANAECLTRTDRIKEQFRSMRENMSQSLRHLLIDIEDPVESYDPDGNEIVS